MVNYGKVVFPIGAVEQHLTANEDYFPEELVNRRVKTKVNN